MARADCARWEATRLSTEIWHWRGMSVADQARPVSGRGGIGSSVANDQTIQDTISGVSGQTCQQIHQHQRRRPFLAFRLSPDRRKMRSYLS